MSEKEHGKIAHIFGGIMGNEPNPRAPAEENLEKLQADFARLGIHIDPSCKIANSTLKKLLEKVNAILSRRGDSSPGANLHDGIISEHTERLRDELVESIKYLDFNIKVGAGVSIGEEVDIGTSVSIGEQTVIGDFVIIGVGTTIGQRCKIGRTAFLNHDCSIGDNTNIEDGAVFEPEVEVPADSNVVHESDNSHMAKIERRLRAV